MYYLENKGTLWRCNKNHAHMSKTVWFVAVGNWRLKKKGSTLLGQFDIYSLFSDTNVCDTYFLLWCHFTYSIYRL